MKITGPPDQIIARIEQYHPEVRAVLGLVREDIPWCKREIAPHQAAVLYALARRLDQPGAHILEIGTARGYSAAVISRAAPQASIVTLNPKRAEYEPAILTLNRKPYQNVRLVPARSWDYLAAYAGPELDLVFVDGDHGLVVRDLPWFNWLRLNGLLLFHDYTPASSGKRPCAPVYETVRAFGDMLGREPDVLVVDDQGDGMAGFYRLVTDHYRALVEQKHIWHLDTETREWVPGRGGA